MVELYTHLFQDVRDADKEQWSQKNDVLHNALHEKLPRGSECPVCIGGGRMRQDLRWVRQDWSFKAGALLWDLTVCTIRKHGTGWQTWRDASVYVYYHGTLGRDFHPAFR